MRRGPDSKVLYCPNALCKQYGLAYQEPSVELERILGAFVDIEIDSDMSEGDKMKWLYDTLWVDLMDLSSCKLADILQVAGDEGWELITCTFNGNQLLPKALLIFKKPEA